MQRLAAIGLWVALVAATWAAAPPTRPDVWAWCVDLMAGRWDETDALIIVHFQLMGLWPLVFAIQLREDLRARPVPMWPFVLGSGALGAFVLLPGLALRPASPLRVEGALERGLGSGWFRGLIGAAVVGWVGWGVATGDPALWAAARASEGFVWTMTLDFLALWAASALLVHARTGRWAWGLVPLIGGLVTAAPAEVRS